MDELIAAAILLALFALRLLVPLFITLGAGQGLNRLYRRWPVEG